MTGTTSQSERDIQVAPEHYDFEAYDDRERWMSYWYQIREALKRRPTSVLEIGPGSGVFSAYLRSAGIDVKLADIDDSRQPDLICDVSKLNDTLPEGLSFDMIAAFQVLEHLPYDQLEPCLQGLQARARKHVLISLPCNGFQTRFSWRFGALKLRFGRYIRLPWKEAYCSQHYWELGPGYSVRKLTQTFKKYFHVENHFYVPENPYHYFWALRVTD